MVGRQGGGREGGGRESESVRASEGGRQDEKGRKRAAQENIREEREDRLN